MDPLVERSAIPDQRNAGSSFKYTDLQLQRTPELPGKCTPKGRSIYGDAKCQGMERVRLQEYEQCSSDSDVSYFCRP